MIELTVKRSTPSRKFLGVPAKRHRMVIKMQIPSPWGIGHRYPTWPLLYIYIMLMPCKMRAGADQE
jgi:hypothetical protein